jgi:twinkle protein
MSGKKTEPTHIENMRDVFEAMMEDRMNPPPSILLPNWPIFNQITGGFRMNEFSIITGSTGVGKTTVLANISYQLMLAHAKQLVMSVETGARDYMARVTSVFAGLDLNTGEAVKPEVFSKIIDDHQQHILGNSTFFSLYEDRISVEQIKQDIKYAVDKFGVQIVFIDNLNYLMEVTRSIDAVIEMDRVIHELIVFCKQTKVHIVMVMHARKPDSDKVDFGRLENEFQIKGSSTAVQEAQNVFLFNRPRKRDVEDGKRKSTDREIIFAKMRRRGTYIGAELVFENRNTKYFEKSFSNFSGSLD